MHVRVIATLMLYTQLCCLAGNFAIGLVNAAPASRVEDAARHAAVLLHTCLAARRASTADLQMALHGALVAGQRHSLQAVLQRLVAAAAAAAALQRLAAVAGAVAAAAAVLAVLRPQALLVAEEHWAAAVLVLQREVQAAPVLALLQD